MEEEMDLRQYWEVLRKRWVIVVVLPLVAALTSGIISFFVHRTSVSILHYVDRREKSFRVWPGSNTNAGE